ncbi:hypothetical protein IKA15_04030 [bacterium]|nr:hypothetical protein [bacterium]
MAIRVLMLLLGLIVAINIILICVSLITKVNLYKEYGKQIVSFFVILAIFVVLAYVAFAIYGLV